LGRSFDVVDEGDEVEFGLHVLKEALSNGSTTQAGDIITTTNIFRATRNHPRWSAAHSWSGNVCFVSHIVSEPLTSVLSSPPALASCNDMSFGHNNISKASFYRSLATQVRARIEMKYLLLLRIVQAVHFYLIKSVYWKMSAFQRFDSHPFSSKQAGKLHISIYSL
jgi:hypothetical protein